MAGESGLKGNHQVSPTFQHDALAFSQGGRSASPLLLHSFTLQPFLLLLSVLTPERRAAPAGADAPPPTPLSGLTLCHQRSLKSEPAGSRTPADRPLSWSLNTTSQLWTSLCWCYSPELPTCLTHICQNHEVKASISFSGLSADFALLLWWKPLLDLHPGLRLCL